MMKSVAICALAALCVMQIADARISQVQIEAQRMKNEIDATQNQLQRAQWDTKFNFDRQIHQTKITGLEDINNVVNPVINGIRSDVDAAKEAGKNAEPCYETARLRLRDLSLEGQNTINRCTNLAKIAIDTLVANMENLRQHGTTIRNSIDSAFLTCYSGNPMQLENCVALKLPSIRTAINGFKSMADSLKNDAQHTIRNAINEARPCINAPAQKIRNEAPSIKTTAARCISNA